MLGRYLIIILIININYLKKYTNIPSADSTPHTGERIQTSNHMRSTTAGTPASWSGVKL